jgi:hypothetical protein
MITDEQMRAAAAAIADEARDNHGGVDVISVGPAFTALLALTKRPFFEQFLLRAHGFGN